MTTKTPAEQQQDLQQYQNLAKASIVHTRNHIRRLAEANKELSEKDYPATGQATFLPGFISSGLIIKLNFETGEKVEFDGSLWPVIPPTVGEGMGQANFLVSPDKLTGFVTTYVQCIEPNPATGGGVIITWVRYDGLSLGTFVSPMAVTTINTVKVGSGTFRKI